MNLYLIWQSQVKGYDTHDSAVVCAENDEEAKKINPGAWGDTWARSSDNVEVKLLGEAIKNSLPGVVLVSFNAG